MKLIIKTNKINSVNMIDGAVEIDFTPTDIDLWKEKLDISLINRDKLHDTISIIINHNKKMKISYKKRDCNKMEYGKKVFDILQDMLPSWNKRKRTTSHIYERHLMVQYLTLVGLTIAEIAELTSLNRSTIYHYRDYIKDFSPEIVALYKEVENEIKKKI